MTHAEPRALATTWNPWRIARWLGASALLLTPLLMMQVSAEWNWSIGDFLLAGTMIGGVGLLYEFAERANDRRAFRAGAGLALVTSLLIVWATLVRDDGSGMAFFMLVMAAAVGSFAAALSPIGMARTMVGVAIMQLLLGLAIATAPDTAQEPHGSLRAVLFAAFFAVLWLLSAACFRAAARTADESASPQ